MDVINRKQNQMSSFLKNKKQKRHNSSRGFQKPPEPEEPTPWKKFKDELLQNQKGNVHEGDGYERSVFLKSRAENYNKFLILQKQNEKPIWEDFSANEEKEDHKGITDILDKGVNPKKKRKKEEDLKRESKANTLQQDFKEENNVQTSLSTTQHPQKYFNANQKNYFRRVITKATCSTKGINLFSALKDLKRCGVKRDIKRKE